VVVAKEESGRLILNVCGRRGSRFSILRWPDRREPASAPAGLSRETLNDLSKTWFGIGYLVNLPDARASPDPVFKANIYEKFSLRTCEVL
jgi:hypothetical protein